MSPDKWHGEERREYTPVDLKHMGWGPRIALMGLFLAMVVNILITGMSYQRLVDSTTQNEDDIRAVRSVDVQLMSMINEMTRAVATLTATVEHLAEDVNENERDLRNLQ